jgi:very-short-patch-repair endonuclease
LVAHDVRGLVRQHPARLPGYRDVRFDLTIPALMWAVEMDLFPTHEKTIGAASDAERDLAATQAGWSMRRVTRNQYEREFNATIADVVTDIQARAQPRLGATR